MAEATFRFYAELNDFLPRNRRQKEFVHAFQGEPAVKDVIQSLGVPHTEVELILIDGEPADFGTRLRAGSHVSVYPVFESLDVGPLVRLRAQPLRETRFVLDNHLGRLARLLRLLGFDTLYRNDYDDHELSRLSSGEHRILLTRDRGLLKRNIVTHGYCVRSSNAHEQVGEVLRRFDLGDCAKPFSRCLSCNGVLESVTREAVADRLPPKVLASLEEFKMCPACGKVYWKGTHYRRLQAIIEEVTVRAGGTAQADQEV
jgi:uncharacterized protein with PIN domain